MKNVLFAVLVLASSCVVSLKDKGVTQVEESVCRQTTVYPDTPAKGPANAPVTILEFTDFQ